MPDNAQCSEYLSSSELQNPLKHPNRPCLAENTTVKPPNTISTTKNQVPGSLEINTASGSQWKSGTTLVIGDSMLNNIDERFLDKNGMVKVRCFSGSTVYDLTNFHMVPLLRKRLTKVIVHIGTNDASQGTSSADSILNAVLNLKKRIEELFPECEVIVSTPVRRFDNKAASNIIDLVNKKLPGLGLNIINNSNIGNSDIGRRGLHLNDTGKIN